MVGRVAYRSGEFGDTTMPKRRTVLVLSALIALLILVVRIRRPLTRWKLLTLAGLRHLLTFNSTPYWGVGNMMFAFSSTLALSRTISDDLSPIFCFDSELLLRTAFPLLADWPACSPSDVLQLPGAVPVKEDAHAR